MSIQLRRLREEESVGRMLAKQTAAVERPLKL